MREDVLPYEGPPGPVIVYDTHTHDGSIHFDVLLPVERASESELNRRALAVAKSFLEAMGADPTWVSISGCSRCHVDDLDRYGGELWHITGLGAWVRPIEGCPTPASGARP